jgi:hypothetical protein
LSALAESLDSLSLAWSPSALGGVPSDYLIEAALSPEAPPFVVVPNGSAKQCAIVRDSHLGGRRRPADADCHLAGGRQHRILADSDSPPP